MIGLYKSFQSSFTKNTNTYIPKPTHFTPSDIIYTPEPMPVRPAVEFTYPTVNLDLLRKRIIQGINFNRNNINNINNDFNEIHNDIHNEINEIDRNLRYNNQNTEQ